MRSWSWLLCSIGLLAACGHEMKKEQVGPTLSTLARQDEPPPEKLPIQPSEPVPPDPKAALENYREILKLTPDPATRAEAMRRLADLQIVLDDLAPSHGDESGLRQAIGLYQQLLKDNPDDPHNDRVLYQLARAHQNVGETEQAVAALHRLSEQFPNSPYAADGRFRRAELLFRMQRFGEAAAEYRAVMDLRDKTPFYDPAQYKYGWSLFKQSKYEDALAVFFDILDRDLPPGDLSDPDAALAQAAAGKRDLTKDALRVAGLSFAAMGGGEAANDYFAAHGEPRYYPMLYQSLGELLLDKQRYSDAAKAYAAFDERYPSHALAPRFQSRVVAAYRAGGFPDLVLREKERYAKTYDPAAPYWAGRTPTPEVMSALRGHLEDLGRYYHAAAQKDPAAHRADFVTAAGWYRRILELYPQDPKAPDIRFLLGDALLDGGDTQQAAEQYTQTAYDYPAYGRTADAAYAAVQAYEKRTGEVPSEERPAALRQAVDSGLKLAERFPQHPQKLPVLTRAAEDLYEMKAYDDAIATAARVTQAQAPNDLKREAWSVTADAQFTLAHYPQAEAAYTQALALTPPDASAHKAMTEQLAASVYKQGDAARAAGDLRAAVRHYLRVGAVAPGASIRPESDYDAAAALIALEDWNQAAQVLEEFRAGFPQHKLIPDVDKKLAVVYQRANRPTQAAVAYARIAARDTETAEVRREAAWQSAQLYDQAKDPHDAAQAYESYVKRYPAPLDPAMDARNRLAELARDRDPAAYRHWLGEQIAADAAGGAARSDRSRLYAARASLALGRLQAADAAAVRLSAPIEKSLPKKRQAMEAAIKALSGASDYGFADVTTAATYELGALYQNFSRALLESDRPRKLSGLALEQYNVLLEEQAYPFEEKAIAYFETNLKRIPQGVYDDSVKKSYDALLAMAPGRYAKNEQAEEIYDALQ